MRPTTFSTELIIAHKAAIVYPDQFNREQVMIQKSLINQNDPDKIEEVDSSAEQSEKYKRDRSSSEDMRQEQSRISVHIGSVEEYLGNRVLFEQGQMKVGDYCFFANIYFTRFKLDNIHDCKKIHQSLNIYRQGFQQNNGTSSHFKE